MPIKRLTVFSVLAAALLVVAPLQATTTSKTYSKTTHAKHTQQKQTHTKSAHRKVAHSKHGKLAATTHKAIHSRPADSATSVADVTLPTTAIAVATVEMKPELPASGLFQAPSSIAANAPVAASVTPAWLNQAPVFNPARMLVQSTAPAYFDAFAAGDEKAIVTNVAVSNAIDPANAADKPNPETAAAGNIADLRKALVAMAMGLRDIRYVRGGHDPSTGFDCSGFVRYVFAHAIGMQLPTNSASQFLSGLKVSRADMKPGDLVFFHTHGKRRISHVGIYISDGQFIHSPATGQAVQISSLNDAYWAKHFAGAKRPEAIAMLAHNG